MSRDQASHGGVAIGVAWFDRDQWKRLKEVAPDSAKLDDSFEDWERNARNVLARIRAEGHRAEMVPIDVEQLLAWCMLQGLAPDGKARASYVSCLMKVKSGDV